jgi:hypothetical protein
VSGRLRVTFDAGEHAGIRTGIVDGYVQVEHLHPNNPNIFAIVVDEKTGTFCALEIYRINMIRTIKLEG